MPTENKPAEPFLREDRYIVLKLNRLLKDEAEYLRDCQSKAMVDCVVVEHDWPEYHLVWAMLEHRMAGKPVPDFNLWRRADELQQRLNAADQRIDELTQCNGEQVALMPVERSYDVRAKQIIAFNTSRQGGGDLDDALDAAYKAALRYTPHPATVKPTPFPGYPPVAEDRTFNPPEQQ